MKKLPGFAKRTEWFLKNRHDLSSQISFLEVQVRVLVDVCVGRCL